MSANDNTGLAGVVVGNSGISTVGKAGVGLSYRGYSIDDLSNSASFEEIAYLLLYGKLPTLKELQQYKAHLVSLRECPENIKKLLEMIPKYAHPMDVLRTACSYLGNIEPESSFDDQINIANRLIATIPFFIVYWYRYHNEGVRIDADTSTDSTAGYFLGLLKDSSYDEEERNALDVSLILYAEHEFNASTFSARITSSTLSDFYSSVVSAIGTLRGPLHGGANEEAIALILSFSDVKAAESGINEMLINKKKIMGFGHRVYKDGDPRSGIVKKMALRLAESTNNKTIFQVAECIERILWDKKKLFPNLDFYSACLYHFCKIPAPLFTPLFVMSRITGWSAHIIEQRSDNKLIRPSSKYNGPDAKEFVLIDDRV